MLSTFHSYCLLRQDKSQRVTGSLCVQFVRGEGQHSPGAIGQPGWEEHTQLHAWTLSLASDQPGGVLGQAPSVLSFRSVFVQLLAQGILARDSGAERQYK